MLFAFVCCLIYVGAHAAIIRPSAHIAAMSDCVGCRAWGVEGAAGGVGYRMRVKQMTWAKDGWHILPNFDVWLEVHCLVSDGISFTVERYYRARASQRPAKLRTRAFLAQRVVSYALLRVVSFYDLRAPSRRH